MKKNELLFFDVQKSVHQYQTKDLGEKEHSEMKE
jgi:hypothetical protein